MPTIPRNVMGLFDTLTGNFEGFLDPVSGAEWYVGANKGDGKNVSQYVPDKLNGLETALGATRTDTSATPGNATANTVQGVVSIAAGQSTITVTNNLVTTSSNVFCQVMGADTTLTSVRVDVNAGNFVIRGNANATAITKVMFVVIRG
jgi:hypothetical protein